MGLLSSMKRRMPLTVTAAGGGVVASLLATLALLSPGYSTQDLEVDDASVWVANGTDQLIGHANTEIASLSTTVSANGSSIGLVQDPSHLIVHDRTNNTLDLVDPAEATTTATVPLPAGAPGVVSGGSQLLMYLPDSGDVWVTGLDDLAAFDAKSAPVISLGVEAVLAADSSDRYAGYSMKSTQLVTGSLTGTDVTPQTQTVEFSGRARDVQVTLVGGRTVLYNPSSAELWADGKFVDLGGYLDDPSSVALMQPNASGDRVLVAHDGGLLAVSLDDHAVTVLDGESRGLAAEPVHLGGCDFAAWSSGTAYRGCGSADPVRLALEGTAPLATLSLAVNGRNVVANDPTGGSTWAVQRDGERIDNWSDFVDDTDTVESQEEERDVPPELDQDQRPPVAVDDEFGARAGRANALAVLLNDNDPNGDALVITEVTPIPPEFGTLDVVNSGQQLQLTTIQGASGTATFEYTVDDGRGGEDTAQVTVTVLASDVNTPPQQVRPTRTSVASGGTATAQVLDDWVDPESDPIFLVDATTAGADTVNFTPDGAVEFVDGGGAGALKSVAVVVSDGSANGNGSMSITVGAVGTVPIIANSFALAGYTGQPIVVEPLSEVRGGTGKITLNGAKRAEGDEGLEVLPDYTAGTFTAVTDVPGTHFVEYSVTDGAQTAGGVVRLEISLPPAEKLPPVTMPTTAFLYVQTTQLVDVLATDHDPGGGVLSIVGVDATPPDSGIVVEIVEQRILRVTLKKALDAGPVTLAYTVSNGYAQATGSLTLVQIPEPPKQQAPVATPDSVTVRVGSVVDIPVLANDRHPNAKPLVLDRTLVSGVGDGGGTLFADGDKLRYLAPDKPGEYSAVYRVVSTDGQWATAPVSITVRDVDVANNRQPIPKTLVARVTAGQKVTIPIPLAGIDPDGDIVTLVGQASSPQLGAISAVGSNSIEYTAAYYSAGTDTFQYRVVDALGMQATGTIRVGISAATGPATPPIAMDDLVTTRPGTTLSIGVTENDSDPEQGVLTVISAESADTSLRPTHTGTVVKVTAPQTEGSYAVLYTIQNPRGGRSSAWLFVQVDDGAPLVAPTARDIVLAVADIDGREKVDIDVLGAVTFSEGTTKDLRVGVPPSFEGVDVRDGTVSVPVTARSRIVPYTVSRRDDPRVSATAFIWVPGTDDAKPERRQGAPELTVVSGTKLTIPVGEQVVAVGDRRVTIVDWDSASAAHADGSALVANSTTLAFTSAVDYWGPASVTFTASDGTNEATITLPITVTPATDQPPVVNSASISLESGDETTVDLLALTDYPYPDPAGKLTFAAEAGTEGVVNASVSGSTLTIRAIDAATIGTQAKVVVSVEDAQGKGRAGIVTVTIVRSTKPLVIAVPDTATVRRGQSVSVDVLANDSATNPFPGKPLRVVSVGSSLPAGVRVKASPDKRTVTVTVAKDAATGNVAIPYQVADVTGDPARYASGVVNVRIQDVPDAPPSAPRIASQNDENATVTLAIPHAFPNFAPISEYVVTAADGTVMARCANPDACVVEGLVYGQLYQFRAVAVNELGEGPPSALSATAVVDIIPNQPQNVTLVPTAKDANGHSLRASWSEPTRTAGTPIERYEVTLKGPGVDMSFTPGPNETSLEVVNEAIQPTGQYTVSILAKNKTHGGQTATATAVAVGPPSLVVVPTDTEAGVVVTWTDVNANGGANLTFNVARAIPTDQQGGACEPTIQGNVAGASWTDPEPATSYGASYAVRVSNGLFCRVFVSPPVPVPPGVPGDVTASLQQNADGVRSIVVAGVDPRSGIHHFQYRLTLRGQAPGVWTTFANATITDESTYGRETTVDVRACAAAWDRSCGIPATFGPFKPLRTLPTIKACFTDGRVPVVTAPRNGDLGVDVQVRYYVTDAAGVRGEPTAWMRADLNPALPPEGAKLLEMDARAVVDGDAFPETAPTICG